MVRRLRFSRRYYNMYVLTLGGTFGSAPLILSLNADQGNTAAHYLVYTYKINFNSFRLIW